MENLPHILPVGTQVVVTIDVSNTDITLKYLAGAVGVIVKSPIDATHAYRVRFLDGTELALKRNQLLVRSHHQNPTIPEHHQTDFYQHVIYRCIVGSRAYGLNHDQSDVDIRGFYIPPADLQWSIFGIPDQLEQGEEAYWEIEKFITLALKANPNILECLYTPLVEYATPLAQELLAIRPIFVSKLIYQTYNGYVMSQFRKLQKDIENYGEIRWKHAMHLIRLLLSGIIALQEGIIPVRVLDEHRPRLLQIRHNEIEWAEVDAWRIQLHKQFDEAFQKTHLPERPDYERANAYLIHARRSVL